jgi:hypothetical protein
MATGILSVRTPAKAGDQGKPIRGQRIGGILVLVGCTLIYSESSSGASSFGAGVGLLLLLVGWGLLIPGQPVDRSDR